MVGKATQWAITDFSGEPGGQVVIEVGGAELPAAQFSMTYGLNAIPTATALIALGRDARTGADSAVYGQINKIKQMAEVKVTIKGKLGDWSTTGANGQKQQWPVGEHVIFVGYVQGITYRRTLGRVSLVMNMVNQLVDLSMSSGGSKDVVPGAPHDLMLPTLFEGTGGKKAATASGKFVTTLPDDLGTDFSEGILNCLEFLAKNSQLQTHDGGNATGGWCSGSAPSGAIQDEAPNDRALQVLRGYGDAWRGIANLVSDPYSEAYPLEVHQQAKDHTSQRVGDLIAGSISGSSMWSLLIDSLLPEFGCAIFPTSDIAYLAPLLPMAAEESITIDPTEYADFNLKTMSQRPLYGVGVMGKFQTSVVAKPGVHDNKQCIGASFTAPSDQDIRGDGMWLFVPAPKWMDDWTNSDPKALHGDADVIALMSKPSHDAVGEAEEAVARDVDGETEDWNDAMAKYAQMMYAANSLRGRGGTIVGKLRFDISPGTTIRVKSSSSAFTSDGVDTLATDVLGLVARVTVTINAEQASAATTFELTNVRTEIENLSPRFSMAQHPFFKDKFFKWAPLVQGLLVS